MEPKDIAKLIIEDEENIDELFNKHLDDDGVDTRYANGVAYLYALVAHDMYGKSIEDCEKAAEQFVKKTIEWHEEHRHDFERHPDFEIEMLSNLHRLRRQAPDIPATKVQPAHVPLKCPACNAHLKSDWVACPNCGQQRSSTVYRGGTDLCVRCGGSGTDPDDRDWGCSACGGSGFTS